MDTPEEPAVRGWGSLTNSDAITAQTQLFESVTPNIYSIYQLLDLGEEPVLQNKI